MKKFFFFAVLFFYAGRVGAQVIACGTHSVFRCGSGVVMACGDNFIGQLGDGTTMDRNLPLQVSGLTGITAVAAMSLTSLYLRNDGMVWACGSNVHGQLGDGTTIDRHLPVQVSGVSNIIAIAVGRYHSIFLKSDGTAWACGSNSAGQLGIGSNIRRLLPVQVSGISGITGIAAGSMHSLYLKNDSTVWATGNNYYGQLGNGTAVDKDLATPVSGLTSVTMVAAGVEHSLFLKNDGTVWACGLNNNGVLGDGTSVNRNLPVKVSSVAGITSIAAGDYHSLFLKSDGTVWACGKNHYGQLGDGTTIAKTVPVRVSGLTGIVGVAAGSYHSLFLKNDGTVWGSGYNLSGELGDGTTLKRTSPVQVQNLCMISEDNTFFSSIKGKVFADINTNCNSDSADILLSNRLIKAEPGSYYGFSDSSGDYIIYAPNTGNYVISIATEDTLWQTSCSTNYNIHVATVPGTTSGIDFAFQASYYCPRLTVDLATSLLRRCFNNTFTFHYRNTGTLPASNAYVEVDFGQYLQPLSSSIPWSAVAGTVYTFPVGNLNINQQGAFTVTALLDCAAQLGSTQCVTAHIFPDTLCVPPPASWDKSDVGVAGNCINDSIVCFTIKNRSAAGIGDMSAPAEWRLYVNDTLITQGTYQLAGGDSLVKCYPANGNTFRFEADQHHPHPRLSTPKAIIESCGATGVEDFGFVTTVPKDDKELAVETFCMQVIGSFDPNDKNVSPAGITSNKLIKADDELEYLIRFQNTGTDTAFTVIIRDTIDTDVLDIATLKSGASSHDYSFNIYGKGIAEWTFNNILLPDSHINEAASHGFVKFKINQLDGNANGTRIENRAAIYFDYNAPVITNTSWNIVDELNFPEAFLSIAKNLICPTTTTAGEISLFPYGGLPPYSFFWSTGDSISQIIKLSPGKYTVTVTDAAGSLRIDSTILLEQKDLIQLIEGGDTAEISESSTYNVTAGFTYTWSVTNGNIVSGQGTSEITVEWNSAGHGAVIVVAADSGCTDTVSKTVIVTEPVGIFSKSENSIEVFPNPTNGTVTLRISNAQEKMQVKVFDALGKMIFNEKLPHKLLHNGYSFDLQKESGSVFLLQVTSERENAVVKLVKY